MTRDSAKSGDGRRIGYARVSKSDMKEGRQTDKLDELCDKVLIEKISGAKKTRPVFDRMLKSLKAGDTLVVLDLDRAFRSSLDALQTMELLQQRGIDLKILNMNLDLSSEFGEVVFNIIAALSQFERKMICRRTREGLEAARKRGVRLGRPPKLDETQRLAARQAIRDDGFDYAEVAEGYGVSASTIRRAVA